MGSRTIKERVAVIEEKIDNIDVKLDTRFSLQEKIDLRQDKCIEDLDKNKADKDDIKEIKFLLYSIISGGIVAIMGAISTKIMGLW